MILEADSSHELTKSYIFFKRMASYIKSTVLLQGFCMLSALLCYNCFLALKTSDGFAFLLYLFFSLYFFSLIITTQLDAYSRYQNYKMAKDLLHQYGFKNALVKVFSKSRCQREAVIEAGNSLGFKTEIRDYFHSMGFRWYHILPDIILKKPQTLFTKSYWLSTFFVPNYTSKYFYW